MSQKKGSRNISSLTDRIKQLEASLGDDVSQYAYYLSEGMKKKPAFVAIWGYSNQTMVNRRYGLALPLILLLKEENGLSVTDKMHMDKEERIDHLTMTALQAHRYYLTTSEAGHGAVYLKAMAIINQMTGDNAPTEHHHMISVTNEQLEAMTHSQRTAAYKRMMSGKLQLIDKPKENIIEGELVTPEGGGATLDEVS